MNQELQGQEQLEVTPQAAAKWANYKRELSLEIMRGEYDLRLKTTRLEHLRAGCSVETVLARAALSSEIADLKDRIAFAQIEHAHASDMLRTIQEFAYFTETPISPVKLEELVSLTPRGGEAVRS